MPAADAELWTTGSNDSCQLGHKGHDTQLYPSRVQALDAHGVCQVACGQQHMLAVADGGALCAWGAADLGQLGMTDTHMHVHISSSWCCSQGQTPMVCICATNTTSSNVLVLMAPHLCFSVVQRLQLLHCSTKSFCLL